MRFVWRGAGLGAQGRRGRRPSKVERALRARLNALGDRIPPAISSLPRSNRPSTFVASVVQPVKNGSKANNTVMNHAAYTCPCCGYQTFSDPPGSYDICPICFWEDDSIQLVFPNLSGGANKVSLIEGQQKFISTGACEPRFKENVRPPSGEDTKDPDWCIYDASCHRGLDGNSKADHSLWNTVKNNGEINLFYWKSDYWRNKV